MIQIQLTDDQKEMLKALDQADLAELQALQTASDDLITQLERTMRRVRVERLAMKALSKLESGRWSVERHFNFVTRLERA